MAQVMQFLTRVFIPAPVIQQPTTREELEAAWHRLYDQNRAMVRAGGTVSREDAAAEDRAYSLYSTAMVNLRRA